MKRYATAGENSERIPLEAVFTVTSSRDERLARIALYWKTATTIVRINRLDVLALSAASKAVRPEDKLTWDAFTAAWETELAAARARSATLQGELAARLGTSSTALPVPQDLPHVGRYETYLERLPATISLPLSVRIKAEGLPNRHQALILRYQAVLAAEEFCESADQAYAAGAVGIDLPILARERLRDALAQFCEAVESYNNDIALYALYVAPPDLPPDRLVRMLILRPDSPVDSSESTGSSGSEPSDRSGDNWRPAEGSTDSEQDSAHPTPPPAPPTLPQNPGTADSLPSNPHRDEAVVPTAALEPTDDAWQPQPNPEALQTPEAVFEPPLVPLGGRANDVDPLPVDTDDEIEDSAESDLPSPIEPYRARRVSVGDVSLSISSERESLRDAVFGNAISDIDGVAASLEECLSRIPSRSQAVGKYWETVRRKAHYANAVDRSAAFAVLRAEAASLSDLPTARRLEASMLNADARLEETRIAYREAGAALGEAMGATTLLRPSDLPLVSAYASRADTLPGELQADPRIHAAQSAIENSFAAVHAAHRGVTASAHIVEQAASRREQIAAVERYYDQVDRWIDAVIDYNQAVAGYAHLAVPHDLPAARYVGVLIGNSR
ncbi:hypothetical protein JCM19992_14990 [Thermostilla marina]